MAPAREHALGPRPVAYEKWRAQLGAADWLCQGTVVRRCLRRKIGGRWVEKGPYYMWTCKQQGRTIGHALTAEQYAVAKAAIAVNRRAMQALAKMQALTLKTILQKMPGVTKRK
jgi:hypothetical protein